MKWRIANILILLFISLAGYGQEDFSLPAIPDTLRTTDSRASWLLLHYWDNCKEKTGNDQKGLSLSPEALEQAFVDYLTLLPLVTDDVRGKAFSLLHGWDIYFLADKYLHSTDSPFHDEPAYSLFINRFVLPPISLINAKGDTITISEACAPRPTILFFDPDCDDCKKALQEASEGTILVDVTAQRGYTSDRGCVFAPASLIPLPRVPYEAGLARETTETMETTETRGDDRNEGGDRNDILTKTNK